MKKKTAIDGRHQRPINNKQKIAEAFLDLILETGEAPSTEAIVERSGVSRRTLFRLFKNRDNLLDDIYSLIKQRAQSRFPFPDPDSERTLEESVRLLLVNNIQIYEYFMPVRVIRDEKKRNRSIQKNQNLMYQFWQEYFHDYFAPHLQDHPDWEMLLLLLHLNLSFDIWATLRNDHGLSIEESRRVLERQILAVLRAD